MRLVLFGPPMAGKGTQASMLARKFGLLHIAMGDLLREAVASGTSLGRKAKKFMDSGNLVPDAIVIGLLEGKIKISNREAGFILDGFPRTVDQAMQLEEFTDVDLVLSIDVPFDKLVERSTGRRVCRSCGAVYHVKFNPPIKPDVCDRDGGGLYRRDDDKETVVKQRLQAYMAQTQPVINYYQSRGKLEFVDGDAQIEEVAENLLDVIRNRWPESELERIAAQAAEVASVEESLVGVNNEKDKLDRKGKPTRRQRGKGRRGGRKDRPKKPPRQKPMKSKRKRR